MTLRTTQDTSFGQRMKQARQDAGLSLMNAAYAIRSRLPEPLWISPDPIRRMEKGVLDEDKADPVLVAALAAAYGVTVEDLSPEIARELGAIGALLRSACPGCGEVVTGMTCFLCNEQVRDPNQLELAFDFRAIEDYANGEAEPVAQSA